MRIQLALQGGGAKLSALLAVAEAVQELQQEREIEVRRIAGTSAGAIVGAILAAGVDVKSLRRDLRDTAEGKNLVNAFAPLSQGKMMWRAYRGEKFWNTEPLRAWLTEVFQNKAKVAKLVKDPKKSIVKIQDCEAVPDLIIMSANLSDSIMEPLAKDKALVAALLDSAALPFCFRTWKADGNLIFDGGLGENLPVHQLSSERSEFGEMVAVTFKRTPPKAPKNLQQFAGALMSFAIDASVARACAVIDKPYLLEVPTTIETLEFAKAIDVGLRREYDEIRDWALGEFRKMKRVSEQTAAAKGSIDPWSLKEPTVQRIMDDLSVMYQTAHQNQPLTYGDVVLEASANCLLAREDDRAHMDELQCKLEFAPVRQPISCHAISLAGFGEHEYRGRIDPKLRKPGGGTIACTPIPSLPSSPRIADDERQMLLFFGEWLEPGKGMYELKFRDEGRDIMWRLRAEGRDELGITLPRAEGRIRKVTILLHVPPSAPNVRVVRTAPESRETNELDYAGSPPNYFRTIGRVFENAAPGPLIVYFENTPA
jgi:NTE family protein